MAYVFFSPSQNSQPASTPPAVSPTNSLNSSMRESNPTRRDSGNSAAGTSNSHGSLSGPVSPAINAASPLPLPIAQKTLDSAAFISQFNLGDYDEETKKLVINPSIRFVRSDELMYRAMKHRARRGIPEEVRGLAWRFMASSLHDTADNPSVYEALLSKKLPQETYNCIANDTGRTMPAHPYFRDSDGKGQQALHNVLHAYATIDPEVGYCQGMGYIAGTLLTQMPEEEAFWTFHTMMHSGVYRMREMYLPGLPLTHQFFFQLKCLLQDYCPRLHQHFETEHVDVSYFAKSWFMTLFVYQFDFDALVRVMDIFFCEGWTIVFRVALALLQWEEFTLITLPLDEILPRLTSVHEGKDPDQILARAMRLRVKHDTLNSLRAKYERQAKSPSRVML